MDFRTVDGGEPAYGYPNSWGSAHRRLTLIGECLDGLARRRLAALGSLSGWRCLEIGAGSGSVAVVLAELVGPTGMVVATDIDTRFLEELKGDRLDVWQHDVVSDPLPEAAFDLIHTRSVLLHLPMRQRVLGKLRAALRPGGWLVLEESDFYPVDVTATEPYRGAWAAVNEALGTAGMASDWARQLPALLQELELSDIAAEAEVAMFPGASPLAELIQLSLRQARAAVPIEARPTVDAAIAALDDPRSWFPGPAIVGVRARRPLQNL